MQKRRIKRDYRAMRSPTKFLTFCKRVQHGLTDNEDCPPSIDPLRQQLFVKVDSLDRTYHVALDGGRSNIRDREKLSEEIVLLLDQIAAFLEATFVLNPDALLTTGFTVTQERRSASRVKVPLTAPLDFVVSNTGDPGKAVATVSTSPGAIIREIHINQKDPSVEEAWFHKANFSPAQEMVMENIAGGNTFFRMRHFGHDGPGPWSAVVSATIT